MTSDWKDCVVTMIDIVGTKRLAVSGKGLASTQMRKLHSLTKQFMTVSAPNHHHAYAWNDSVLLLAYAPIGPGTARGILAEAEQLKNKIDSELSCKSYAVCVRGQTFPERTKQSDTASCTNRCTILQTSSFAMANCFTIEKELSRYRAEWYIQNRLRNSVSSKPFATGKVKLLPTFRENIKSP